MDSSIVSAAVAQRSQRLARVVASFVVVLLAMSGLVFTASSAQAASRGVGFAGGDGSWQGQFSSGGRTSWCFEPGVSEPSGSTTDLGYVSTLVSNGRTSAGTTISRTLTANDMARLNRIFHTWGSSTSNRRQTAISFAVKYISNPQAMFNSHNWTGGSNLAGFINWVMYSSVGSTEAAAIATMTQQMLDTTAGTTPGFNSTGEGDLVFDIDHTLGYVGTMTMVGTAGSVGTVTLEKAIFLASGTDTLTNVQEGVAYDVLGTGTGVYHIKGQGQFMPPAPTGFLPELRRFRTTGQQGTIGPGRLPTAVPFAAEGEDPIPDTFSPVVTTSAADYVSVGDPFTDTLTFATSEGEWRTLESGSYFQIKATGTLYGPFAAAPVESAVVPDDAPVAATATVTTGTQGPNVSYTASAGIASEVGFYTWVWRIDAADQTVNVRAALPVDYVFQDRFGLAAETSFVGMRPVLTSAVSDPVTSVGASVTDVLTIENSNGEWIPGVAATFNGTAYAVTSGISPVEADTVPTTGAVAIGTVQVTVTEPGEYESPAVTVPDEAGYVVWVWEFVTADQPEAARNRFDGGYEWSDRWALPAETSRVQFEPELTTEVSATFVPVGSEFNDQVTVTVAKGQWTEGAEIIAEGTLYGPFLNRPTASTAVPAGAPVAGSAQLQFTEPGMQETDSGIKAPEAGFYTWVWKIRAAAQTGDFLPAGYEYADRFGLASETSITAATITAVSEVTEPIVGLGERLTDTLTVSSSVGGWLEQDGNPIPVTFRGTAYFTPTKPALTVAVPDDAEALGSTLLTVDGPGFYISDEVNGSNKPGFVVWVWEILPDDQPAEYRGWVNGWADLFGLEAETHHVVLPEATSVAQTVANVDEGFTDTATITGPIPAGGAQLHFELYQALQGDAGWVCTDSNRLWVSETQIVEEPGDYQSGTAPGQPEGTYHWVEVLTWEGQELHRGECGLPNETTHVIPRLALTGGAAIFAALGLGISALLLGFGLHFTAHRRRKLSTEDV